MMREPRVDQANRLRCGVCLGRRPAGGWWNEVTLGRLKGIAAGLSIRDTRFPHCFMLVAFVQLLVSISN